MPSFGLALQNFSPQMEGLSAQRVIKDAELVERLGFDSVWAWDHIFLGTKNPFKFLDALSILSAIASTTSRVRLGTAAIVLPLRNPLALAKAVATIDQISNGRMILGVAAGWYQREFDACGVNFEERGKITESYFRMLRALLSGSPVEMEYGSYRMRNVSIEPKPLQKPRLPIYMGGYVDAALKRTARLADGWICYCYTPRDFRESWEKLKRYAEQCGRGGDEIASVHLTPVCLGSSAQDAQARAEQFMGRYFDMPPWSKASKASFVTGTDKECAAKLSEYVGEGVQNIVLLPATGDTSQMEAIARDVLPAAK